MMKRLVTAVFILALVAKTVWAQGGQSDKPGNKVIIDTDIGDDIDDAFALALALRSPEIDVIGITTAWGNTELRARLANRLVKEAGSPNIPVLFGVPTTSKTNFTQSDWAQQGAISVEKGDAVKFLLDEARMRPGEVTLVAIGPLTNIGAAIDRDAG